MLALTFAAGGDRLALDIRRVAEVVPRVRLAPLAGAPAWLAGTFVYRGQVVPVIDLHRLRQRMVDKPVPNIGPTVEPNEYALQMLRFPYRQVFGDPDNLEGQKFYALDRFKATISLVSWKATVAANIHKVKP